MEGKEIFEIIENRKVARRTMRMLLKGDTTRFWAPGQFVNILVPGKYLRRPISVADYTEGEEGTLTLFYDIVGEGTAILAEMRAGEHLQLLTGLGNGFDTSAPGNCPVLLGGGIGCAPMLRLAKDLVAAGKRPVVALGFNTAADISVRDELMAVGIETHIATADGSEGTQGFVTDLLRKLQAERKEKGEEPLDYFYACGPNPMLKAICKEVELPGEVSVDERMGCGFGICVCCTVKTTEGPKRSCKEGPVFKKEILLWE